MVILYPSLTNVIFVNKAHPQVTEKIRLISIPISGISSL